MLGWDKAAKLAGEFMSDKAKLQSEGERLDSFLHELQRDSRVKEISGWSTGFGGLDHCLDGIRPGLCLLLGRPGCGKTALAKQLVDQIVADGTTAGIYFTFTESVRELRLRTLARLSEIDSRALRRGSAYLLHWYGVPRLNSEEAAQLPASWEKVRRTAQEANSWLDRLYLVECDRSSTATDIERCIYEVRKARQSAAVVAVIDDCVRLAPHGPWLDRINRVAELLQAVAVETKAPIFAVAAASGEFSPNEWSEKIASGDVILELENDHARAGASTESVQAMTLHIIKNRGGERGKLALDFAPAFARFSEAVGR